MRITEKQLEKRVEYLNDLNGFKGHIYKRLKNGKVVQKGSGFQVGYAYGGARLEFMSSKGGCSDVSPRLRKGELYDYVNGMIEGVRYYSDRVKLR
tara:strand:- start:240 stop:524 length:285 start_codon:yes stop_codon:yes gene_type:complete